MLGFFAKLLFGFLALLALPVVVDFLLPRKDTGDRAPEEEVLSQKSVENVADLNDHFCRARSMGRR